MNMQPDQLIVHSNGIGKSCIEVLAGGKRILLDCGMKPVNSNQNISLEDIFPTTVKDFPGIDLVIITHSHLDHNGGLPFGVNRGLNCPVICTPVAKSISEVQYYDSYRLNRRRGLHAFSEVDIKRTLSLTQTDHHAGQIGDVFYKLFPAGHIPGSVIVYLEYKGKTILYTGDVNDRDTRLVSGCNFGDLPKGVDVIITETTYASQVHKAREDNVESFKQLVLETVANKGSVIIPAFAINRTQEVLLLLSELDLSCPIIVDGMGAEITSRFLKHPDSLRNSEALRKAFLWTKKVDFTSRKRAGKMEQAIYVTTPGMVGSGGGAISYLREKGGDKKNIIIICGFQAKGTGGRQLLDEGYIEVKDGKDKVIEVIEPVNKPFPVMLSSHLDADGLKRMFNIVQPQLVIPVHGEPESRLATQKMAIEAGCKIITPVNGIRIDI